MSLAFILSLQTVLLSLPQALSEPTLAAKTGPSPPLFAEVTATIKKLSEQVKSFPSSEHFKLRKSKIVLDSQPDSYGIPLNPESGFVVNMDSDDGRDSLVAGYYKDIFFAEIPASDIISSTKSSKDNHITVRSATYHTIIFKGWPALLGGFFREGPEAAFEYEVVDIAKANDYGKYDNDRKNGFDQRQELAGFNLHAFPRPSILTLEGGTWEMDAMRERSTVVPNVRDRKGEYGPDGPTSIVVGNYLRNFLDSRADKLLMQYRKKAESRREGVFKEPKPKLASSAETRGEHGPSGGSDLSNEGQDLGRPSDLNTTATIKSSSFLGIERFLGNQSNLSGSSDNHSTTVENDNHTRLPPDLLDSSDYTFIDKPMNFFSEFEARATIEGHKDQYNDSKNSYLLNESQSDAYADFLKFLVLRPATFIARNTRIRPYLRQLQRTSLDRNQHVSSVGSNGVSRSCFSAFCCCFREAPEIREPTAKAPEGAPSHASNLPEIAQKIRDEFYELRLRRRWEKTVTASFRTNLKEEFLSLERYREMMQEILAKSNGTLTDSTSNLTLNLVSPIPLANSDYLLNAPDEPFRPPDSSMINELRGLSTSTTHLSRLIPPLRDTLPLLSLQQSNKKSPELEYLGLDLHPPPATRILSHRRRAAPRSARVKRRLNSHQNSFTLVAGGRHQGKRAELQRRPEAGRTPADDAIHDAVGDLHTADAGTAGMLLRENEETGREY